MKSGPSQRVQAWLQHHVQSLQADSHLSILRALVRLTETGVVPSYFPESPQCFLAQDVAPAATGVALTREGFEAVTEEHGLLAVFRWQQETQILHNDVGVVVCFQKPLGVMEVVLVDVRKRLENTEKEG